jgi:hypothetical protein
VGLRYARESSGPKTLDAPEPVRDPLVASHHQSTSNLWLRAISNSMSAIRSRPARRGHGFGSKLNRHVRAVANCDQAWPGPKIMYAQGTKTTTAVPATAHTSDRSALRPRACCFISRLYVSKLGGLQHHPCHLGPCCISPLPKDQSSRLVSTRLIHTSSFRTHPFAWISSAIPARSSDLS